jgi:multiple sugar transport system permease protein
MLSMVASRAAAAIDNARLYEDLQATFRQTIASLARTIDKMDRYTAGHSERVARYASRLAKSLGLDDAQIEVVRQAALMHDIGKIGCVMNLTLAVVLNSGLRGMGFYRMIYFMPVVTSIVAAAMVFQFLLNRDTGVISNWMWWVLERFLEIDFVTANEGLSNFVRTYLTPPDWLNDPAWAKPAVVLLTLWKNVGFTMVIYLAALQGVPQALYEAAEVDGASMWQRVRHITIPLVSPTTFFLLIIQMLGAFQIFEEPFVMTANTQGQLPVSSMSIVIYIYQNAFRFQRMGKAAAIAWVLFAIVFVLTLIQMRLQRRWVHYETD